MTTDSESISSKWYIEPDILRRPTFRWQCWQSSPARQSAVRCGPCGGVYALSKRFVEHKRERGGFWNCPYCKGSWGYPEGGSEVQKLRNRLESMESSRDFWKKERECERERVKAECRKAAAARGQVTRIKNRIKNGVCPLCNRTFPNLARHMASKHGAECAS